VVGNRPEVEVVWALQDKGGNIALSWRACGHCRMRGAIEIIKVILRKNYHLPFSDSEKNRVKTKSVQH